MVVCARYETFCNANTAQKSVPTRSCNSSSTRPGSFSHPDHLLDVLPARRLRPPPRTTYRTTSGRQSHAAAASSRCTPVVLANPHASRPCACAELVRHDVGVCSCRGTPPRSHPVPPVRPFHFPFQTACPLSIRLFYFDLDSFTALFPDSSPLHYSIRRVGRTAAARTCPPTRCAHAPYVASRDHLLPTHTKSIAPVYGRVSPRIACSLYLFSRPVRIQAAFLLTSLPPSLVCTRLASTSPHDPSPSSLASHLAPALTSNSTTLSAPPPQPSRLSSSPALRFPLCKVDELAM